MRLLQTAQHLGPSGAPGIICSRSLCSETTCRSSLFDLEKAYERTWKFGIMRDLHDAGLRGRLPCFIENFLKNRKFCVRLNSCFSDQFDQEMGVPQGSILSVVLFDIAAKAALSFAVTPMKLPASEFFPHVNKLISEDWQ